MKLIYLILIVLSIPCYSSDESGIVSQILVRQKNTDMVHIKVDGDNQGKPSCATNNWEYVIDISNETGKTMYSFVLAAHMSGKPIFLMGTGTCAIYSTSETVDYIHNTL